MEKRKMIRNITDGQREKRMIKIGVFDIIKIEDFILYVVYMINLKYLFDVIYVW